LLKTFWRLGHFLSLRKAPRKIAEYILLIYSAHYGATELEVYDGSGSRYRHITRIREYLGISGTTLWLLLDESGHPSIRRRSADG
jgi:hypothetical protein